MVRKHMKSPYMQAVLSLTPQAIEPVSAGTNDRAGLLHLRSGR